MSMLADVTKQALALPVEERVVLAQRVWDSVAGHCGCFSRHAAMQSHAQVV